MLPANAGSLGLTEKKKAAGQKGKEPRGPRRLLGGGGDFKFLCSQESRHSVCSEASWE